MSDFQERLEQGYYEEYELIQFIHNFGATPDDDIFMNHFKFDIADILNGRLNENVLPMFEIQNMIDRWNDKIGFKVIFAQYV